jgi:hypothetical protein
MTTVLWGGALLVGLLWPSRLIGWLDGAPLDQSIEVMTAAALLPALWYLDPGYLRSRAARATIAALAIWKIATWALLGQTGWCALFAQKYEPPNGWYRLDRSWDARTLWTATPPACSAIVARPYEVQDDFPAWTINVPFGSNYDLDAKMSSQSTENPRPPAASYLMVVSGWMSPRASGALTLDLGSDTTVSGTVDDRPIPVTRAAAVSVPMSTGTHAVDLRLDLVGSRWRFVPTWNGSSLFRAVPTTVRPPSALDRMVAGWGRWIPPLLIAILFATWIASAVRTINTPSLVAWAAGSAAVMFTLGALLVDRPSVRLLPLALAVCALVRVPARLQTPRGAFLLFGLPWLAFFGGRAAHTVGRFTVYTFGDDMLTFQRFAHRIFMEGYWLEGGERTFWWQPLYRWILGVLHVAFGDSSIGEMYWDAFGVLIGAIFAFEVVRRLAGWRFGIAAGVLTLITVTVGPNWYIVGRGLGDISAAAWLYLAAFLLLRARDEGRVAPAFAAGLFATLAFLTRLNHLPLVIAMLTIVLPATFSAGSLVRVADASRQLPKRIAAAYLVCIGAGITAFAARTWYFTGDFSFFAGTTIKQNGTGLGLTLSSFASAAAWRSALESVMMIVTVQDPPRFDVRAVLVLGGVVAAVGGLLGAPVLRRLPLAPAVMCVAGIVGGLVARGQAYPGRFSIHVIPVAVALSIGTIALLAGTRPYARPAAGVQYDRIS